MTVPSGSQYKTGENRPNRNPQYAKHNTLGSWAKSDKGKADLFAEHLSEVFTPYNNDQNHEVEQELEIHIHQQDRLKPFTLKEIKKKLKN